MRYSRHLAGGLSACLALLAACQPPAKEAPLPTAPLLETLPANYRPLDRQDTLTSDYTPDSGRAAGSVRPGAAPRPRVLVRAQFVAASAMRRAGRDTLTFRHTYGPLYADDYTGYAWQFSYLCDRSYDLPEDADGLPLRLRRRLTTRLALVEYRRRPENGAVYRGDEYLLDYPFYPVAQAIVSDSVLYVRAYAVRPDAPRPDTLVTYFRHGPHQKRVSYAADQLDTTRQATIRFSFRPLPAGRGTGRPAR